MIPILYEADATSFITNGIARLRDAASVLVTEEKNGVYELNMTYPVDGAHFEDIIPGRIIAVTHDDSGDIQPFDIVSYSKPIDGMATFHAVHISYRQSFLTVTGQNINSLADALDLLATAEPTNPFTYQTDISSNAYLAAADGTPKSVRQLLGGSEGSILDAYGGEYEFDGFTVNLWRKRGQNRDFAVRYGINMTAYQDDTDYLGAFTSCIPFWTGGDAVVIGNKVDSGLTSYNGRDLCVPLDLTDKFETEPSTADLEAEALAYMTSNQSNLPQQNIKVDFLRLQDFSGYEDFQNLMACNLCDTISVVFPKYAMTGTYQIVRTVWNVLENRYQEMELGALQTTLAEALGISGANLNISGGGGNFVTLDTEQTITAKKTLTDGAVISRATSGAILELSSAASDTNFQLKRTNGSTCVLESGTSVGLFGTKTNHPLQVRTNYVNRMTVGTDGSVVLTTAPSSSSNNNQVATTKWVRERIAGAFTTFTPASGTVPSGQECYYAKAGNVVTVNIAVSGLTANSTASIVTLPAGYRPRSKITAAIQAGARSEFCSLEITTAGVVTIATHATRTSAFGLVTFIVE